jgi:hypothetical protein
MPDNQETTMNTRLFKVLAMCAVLGSGIPVLSQAAERIVPANPRGGSATGGFDHIKPLMLLQRIDFTDIRKLKYISLNGGADAIKQTIDGFTQALTGDMSMVHGGVVR